MCLGSDAAVDENKMRGYPGKIEWRQCAQKVTAIDGAQAVSKDKVVDDARPEGVGHAEGFGGREVEVLEAEE